MFLVDVDDDFLDRLQELARRLVLLENDARARHRELEALPAHGLDQDRELQFAAAGDGEGILVGRFLDLEGDVAVRLLEEPVADHPARHLVAFGAGERRIVDDEGHGDGRRIDRLRRQGDVVFERGEGVRHGALLEAGEGDDVARLADLDRLPLDAAEGEDLRDAAGLDRPAGAVEDLDRLVRHHMAGADAPGDDAAEERVRLEDGAEHAEGAGLDLGRRHVVEHEVEQRREAAILRPLGRGSHPAVAAGAVEDREVELLVRRVQRGEEVEDLVDDLARRGRPAGRPC